MRRKNFIRRAKTLPTEKKIIMASSILVFISCFLPWYGINSRVINEWWNAFGSIGSVAGYLIAGFSLLSLALILLPSLRPGFDIEQKLPLKESSLLLFLSGQSFFVTLVFIPVYAQYSLINAANSGARFGLYLALLGSLISSISALSYRQKNLKESLSQPEFAKVPRAQRDLSEWENEEPESDEVEEVSEYEQETMFNAYNNQSSESVSNTTSDISHREEL